MKKSILLPLLFLFAGCTAPSVTYIPYTQEVYLAKSEDSPLIIGDEILAKRQFTSFGRLSVEGSSWGSRYTPMNEVTERFAKEALARGADGVAAIQVNSTPYEYDAYVPGYTTYEPVMTHHTGNVSGNTYGSAYSSYGGWVQGSGSFSGNYFGTSTTDLPVYHSGFTVHHSGFIHSLSGDLIVLLDKDTYGYIGVALDMNARNIDGARIASVLEGSAAMNAGLKTGDVITKLVEVEIRDCADFLRNPFKVGKPVEIGYRRGNEHFEAVLLPHKGYYGALKKNSKQIR